MTERTPIPTTITLDESEVGFMDIHREFTKTDYGTVLIQNTRYSRYQPDNVSNQEWERLLGVDVNNLKHLQLSYGLTHQFLSHCAQSNSADPDAQFTPSEQQQLLFTAVVHDWGEAVVGDIMYDAKTQEDEDEELVILKDIISNMHEHVNPEDLSSIIDTVGDTLSDRTSKLGKAFNAIERVGYVRTALRAWENAQFTSDDLRVNLEWLTHNVFLNQIPKLIEYSEIYPPVKEYLQSQRNIIFDAFTSISPEARMRYGEKKEQYDDEFAEIFDMWVSKFHPDLQSVESAAGI